MTTFIEHQPRVVPDLVPASEDHEATNVAAPHDPHLAHHFNTPKQQFEAAKLGMWLFIATEFLLFGGLFCLYAIFRSNRPEMFQYGAKFLDVKWGAINTLVLILSSLTMALAVYAAQTDRRRLLVSCLSLTVLGGAVFMGIKYIEYSHKFDKNLVWGVAMYDLPSATLAIADTKPFESLPAAPAAGDLEKGRMLWSATCRSCHGVAGEGIAGMGKDMRGTEFIDERDDKQLVDFIKAGRMPFDPMNTTGIQMPPKGGNPMLKDQDLLDIVAYMRTFQAPAAGAAEQSPDDVAAATQDAPEEELFIPKSSMPNAPAGPSGLVTGWIPTDAEPTPAPLLDPRLDPDRPENLHLFFGIYFMMTGLHGLHVLVGMGLIGWLTVRAMLGHFSLAYYTPVDLTGLYWHVVDIIWIFLFPLLYLIH